MNKQARWNYDLSHFAFLEGRIGALQTLAHIPIIAGDSIDLSYQGVFRLSPLRRNLMVDGVVDLFGFFVPWRHVYGDDWIDFLKQGIDEGVALTTTTSNVDLIQCTGMKLSGNGSVFPLWAVAPYSKIWNRYFKDPTDANTLDDDHWTQNIANSLDNRLEVGEPCCNLKRIWNTGVVSEVDTSDSRVALTDGNTTLDLYALAQGTGRLESELQREFFAQRYQDVIRSIWGGNVSEEVDQRPYLLMRKTQWLSGYDVDNTGDDMGNYTGKGTAVCSLDIPSKFFPEHGSLMVMALVRFPPIVTTEKHYLASISQPTYKQIAGDPSILMKEPPIELEADDFFIDGVAGTSLGKIPYAQWYREHPHYSMAESTTDLPFRVAPAFETMDDVKYIPIDAYDHAFSSVQQHHWQAQGAFRINAKRCIPDPRSSIFAGTTH